MNVAPTIANRGVSPLTGRPGQGPGINHHPAYGPGPSWMALAARDAPKVPGSFGRGTYHHRYVCRAWSAPEA